LVTVKMSRSKCVPGFGELGKNRIIELPENAARFVVQRNWGTVIRGRLIELDIVAIQGYNYREIEKQLVGTATSGIVHVVGAGPSAKRFVPDGNPVIALNKAITLVDADVWLVVEGHAVRYDWMKQWVGKFPGKAVFTTVLSTFVEHEERNSVEPGWWESVLWTIRLPYKGDLRECGNGLVGKGGMLAGGAGLCGVNLAAIMIGDRPVEIHTWGMELYFPDGVQHFDGDKPYLPCGERSDWKVLAESEVRFDWDGKRAVVRPGGELKGTKYFIDCAEAIVEIVGEQKDFKLIDHSDGLLSWYMEVSNA